MMGTLIEDPAEDQEPTNETGKPVEKEKPKLEKDMTWDEKIQKRLQDEAAGLREPMIA